MVSPQEFINKVDPEQLGLITSINLTGWHDIYKIVYEKLVEGEGINAGIENDSLIKYVLPILRILKTSNN